MKKSKKAVELTMNTIIIVAILLIALIIILAMFTNIFGKETTQIKNYVNQLDDCDKDGIANTFDPCPCNPNKDLQDCPTEDRLVSCKENEERKCESKNAK